MQGRAWRLVVPLCFLSNDRHSGEYGLSAYTRILITVDDFGFLTFRQTI